MFFSNQQSRKPPFGTKANLNFVCWQGGWLGPKGEGARGPLFIPPSSCNLYRGTPLALQNFGGLFCYRPRLNLMIHYWQVIMQQILFKTVYPSSSTTCSSTWSSLLKPDHQLLCKKNNFTQTVNVNKHFLTAFPFSLK